MFERQKRGGGRGGREMIKREKYLEGSLKDFKLLRGVEMPFLLKTQCIGKEKKKKGEKKTERMKRMEKREYIKENDMNKGRRSKNRR